MDATRSRRTRDLIRQGWYAHHRSVRLARRMGFSHSAPVTPRTEARSPDMGGLPTCTSLALAGGLFCFAAYLGWTQASLKWASLAWVASEHLLGFPQAG